MVSQKEGEMGAGRAASAAEMDLQIAVKPDEGRWRWEAQLYRGGVWIVLAGGLGDDPAEAARIGAGVMASRAERLWGEG